MTLVRKSKYIAWTICFSYTLYDTISHHTSGYRCSCNSRMVQKKKRKLCKHRSRHDSTTRQVIYSRTLLHHLVKENTKKKCLPIYLPLVMLSGGGYSANQKKFDIFAAMRMKGFDHYYVEIRNCTTKSPIGTVYLLMNEKTKSKLLGNSVWIHLFADDLTYIQSKYMEHGKTLNNIWFLIFALVWRELDSKLHLVAFIAF